MKTPDLRHEHQVQEWQAIAVRYFPQLHPLYGRSYSSVTDSFLQYVSNEERKVLKLSLESFESVDKDELMDVLDAHDCHHLASGDTTAGLVSQVGHKTLVQTPMFGTEC